MSEETQTYTEQDPNAGVIARITNLLKSTEVGIVIETPTQVDPLHSLAHWACTEQARKLGPRWNNARPEIVVASFSDFTTEVRLMKPEVVKGSGGTKVITYTTPVDGTESDFNPTMGYKPLPYGDPIDVDSKLLEDVPIVDQANHPGAKKRAIFEARQNPEAIMNSLLKSINNFSESANGRGRIYVVQSAERFLNATTFAEMTRSIIDKCRNVLPKALGIVFLVPLAMMPSRTASENPCSPWNGSTRTRTTGASSTRSTSRAAKSRCSRTTRGNGPRYRPARPGNFGYLSGWAHPSPRRGCHSDVLHQDRCHRQGHRSRGEALASPRLWPDSFTPDPDAKVGGLRKFHEYVEVERNAMLPEAKSFGVKPTRMSIYAGPLERGSRWVSSNLRTRPVAPSFCWVQRTFARSTWAKVKLCSRQPSTLARQWEQSSSSTRLTSSS